jgi:hypothetical protein
MDIFIRTVFGYGTYLISVCICTQVQTSVGPLGNFSVTFASLKKKKKPGKQIGQRAQMNIKFIIAKDHVVLK